MCEWRENWKEIEHKVERRILYYGEGTKEFRGEEFEHAIDGGEVN